MKKNRIVTWLTSALLALVLVAGLMPGVALNADAAGTSTTGTVFVDGTALSYNLRIETLTITDYSGSENHDSDCGALLYSVRLLSPNNYRVSFKIRYEDNGYGRETQEFSMDLQLSGDCRNGRSVDLGTRTFTSGNTSYQITGSFSHSARNPAVHGGGTATCTELAACSICGMTYGEKNVDNHAWGNWSSNGNGTHTRVCSRDNTHTETKNCSGGTATCGAKAVCTGCSTAYGAVNPANHVWGEWTTTDTTHSRACTLDPTHTDSGNHDATAEGGAAATCTDPAVCGVCKESYGSALGHSLAYAKTADNVLKESCENCTHTAEATLTAEDKVYTGAAITDAAAITYGENWLGTEKPTAITCTDNTNVGTATAKITVEGKELSTTFAINPKALDTDIAKLSAASGTYTGEAHAPEVTLSYNGKTLIMGTDYTLSAWQGDMTTPGEHFITATGMSNFSETQQLTYTIEKAELTGVSVTQKGTLTYTGEDLTPEVTANATAKGGQTVSFTYSIAEGGTYGDIPVLAEAGQHTVYFKASALNHNDVTGSFTVTIGKAEPTVTPPAAVSGLAYDGTEKELITAGTSEHGTFQYRLSESDDWSDAIPTGTNAGSYTVYWKLVGDENHSDTTGSVSVNVGRTQTKLTAADFTYTAPEDLTYSGTAKAAKVEVSGKSGVGEITVKYNKDPINPGTYKVTIDVAQGTNYEAVTGLTSDAWTFTITKAVPVISWETLEYTYNGKAQGKAQVELVNGSYTGTVTYTYAKNGGTAVQGLPTDAGTYTVTAAVAAHGNYEAAAEEAEITIHAKSVNPTLVLSSDTYTYNGQAHEPAVKVKVGLAEIPASEYTVDYSDNTAVGAADVVVEDKEGGNYIFTKKVGVFLILPDASELEGVTAANVNSENQADIDAVQAAMKDKDITGAGVAAKAKWEALAKRCTDLEAAIADAAEGSETITDGVAALPENPTTDDLETVKDLLDTYEDIKGNLTEAEQEALAEEIETLKDLKTALDSAKAELKTVTDGVKALDPDDLEYADKATILKLKDKITKLEKNSSLSASDKFTLASAKSELQTLEAEFTEADKVTELLRDLPVSVTPEDTDERKTYLDAKKAYEDLGTDKNKVNPAAVKKLEALKDLLTNYRIIKGGYGRWAKGSTKGLSFTANGNYSEFAVVKVDGKTVSSSNYTSAKGSTVITLKPEYLKSLKLGTHTISISFDAGEFSGEAVGAFRTYNNYGNPFTGDNANVMLYAVLAVLSALCVTVLILIRRNKNKR